LNHATLQTRQTWWIDVITPSGQRIRQSTGAETKALAQEYHDKLKAELWRIGKLGELPSHTWNEAVVRWLKEQSHKASIETNKIHLRWLDAFLSGKPLDSISRLVIDRIIEAKKAEGVTNATVNRVLEVLRAILRRCVNEWEWLEKAPAIRLLKEPARRIRFLTRQEADSLIHELPEHLADMMVFHAGHRASAGQCHGAFVVAGGFDKASRVDPPGSGEGEESHSSAAEFCGGENHCQADWQAPDARFHLSGEPDSSGQHENMVFRAQAGRYREFPLARLAAYLGELACTERNAVVRLAGNGGLGKSGDGAAVCASGGGSLGALRGTPLFHGLMGSFGRVRHMSQICHRNKKANLSIGLSA
jgi:hypothetical protein